MKPPLFIFFLFLFSTHLYTQSVPYEIKIKTNPLGDYPYYCKRVIDGRLNKTNIGTVHKGLDNKLRQAMLEKKYKNNLGLLFEKLIPYDSNKKPIILVINKLNICERQGGLVEHAYCDVEIEILEESKDSLFSFGIFKNNIKSSNIDVTSRHKFNIRLAIKGCLDTFALNHSKIKKRYFDKSLINMTFDYTKLPQDGFYTSYHNFIRNTPCDSCSGVLNKFSLNEKSSRFDLFNCTNKKYCNDILFIVFEGNLYLNAILYTGNNYFIKVKQFGRFIYFEDRFKKSESGIILSGSIAGLIGGIIVSSFSGTRHAMVLDTQTGDINILGNKRLYNLIKEHKDIVKTYRNSKRKRKDTEMAIKELNLRY